MTIRRSLLFCGLALVVATAIQPNARAQGAPIPFWAQDRRPIAAIGLFNGSWEYGNTWIQETYGLHECWRIGSSLPPSEGCGRLGGVRWLMAEIQRRYDLDYRRFMLHLPAGRELSQQGIPLPSAQWHVLDSAGIESPTGSVREDLQVLLTDWLKDHPDVQVVIYQGLRFDRDFFPEAWLERGNMDATHAVVPEITNPAHRTIVQQITLGWLDLTPPRPYRARPQIGFAFDNTGVLNTRDALVAVAEDTSLFRPGTRVFVSGEAIPHQILSGACAEANLLTAYTNRAPWLATMDFYQRFDKDQSWSALPSQHLGFAVRNREYRLIRDPEDGSCQVDRNPPAVPLSDEQVRAAICSAHIRGFVIIHYGGRHDAYIRSLSATSPQSCSIPFRGGDNPPTESGRAQS